MMISSDYDRILQVLKFSRKIITSQNSFNCEPIFKFFAAQTKRQILRRKYFGFSLMKYKISVKYHYQRLEIRHYDFLTMFYS